MSTLKISLKNLNINGYDCCFIDLCNCTSTDVMFNIFSKSLGFIDGFGNSWDAFHDSILNLCFCVKKGLVLVLDNCDNFFQSDRVETEYLLNELYCMALGQATQDDGKQIDVCIKLNIMNSDIMEKVFCFFKQKIGADKLFLEIL